MDKKEKALYHKCMLTRQIHLERGLLMEHIISKLFETVKDTRNFIEAEESMHYLMQEWFSGLVGDMLTSLSRVVKEKKQSEGWRVKREDCKTIQFMFGPVCYRRTLMVDPQGENHYPLDEWLGIRKHQRQSPLVEVKVAEMASEATYRETARVLKDWTAVHISHQTVGNIVKQVGAAQAREDENMVTELEEAAALPEGKHVDYLYAEADGVFIRGTEKKKGIEVSHGVVYEGWDTNGKRVSLQHPKAVMTTQPTSDFWKEVQAITASHYSLEKTQVVTNSDGGKGYTAEKFQEAFSQSAYPVFNQLDSYHVFQALNRALGAQKSEYKEGLRKALKGHDKEDFRLWLDTYESTLEEPKKIEKVKEFRTYILKNWDRIFDWRDKVKNTPEGARSLGAMESNQRHISFRMKKRGMHWSREGGEAMVKIKQGILNGTLRDAYLQQQPRSVRKQREFKKMVRLTEILRQPTRPSVGVKDGSVALYTAHSTAMGNLMKSFQ